MEKLNPVLKFPTTLIVVDDNVKFLSNLGLVLGQEYKYKNFSLAKEALKFALKQDLEFNKFYKKYISGNLLDESTDVPTINFDIQKLHHIVYDPNRFSLSTVLITDYAMPDMNGMELCQQLVHTIMKTIMLTGEAGYDLAVTLFNQRSINQFVLKSDADFIKKVKEYAIFLENFAFQESSKLLINAICNEDNCIFNDPIFIQFFDDLVKKLNIVEYYLLDMSGSYLLLDAEAKVYWLIVKNEEEMRSLYELALDDKGVPSSIMSALKDKKKLVYFPTERHKLSSAKDWPLEDASLLKGRENYYFAISEGVSKNYPLNTDNILSYQDYIRKSS